MCYQGASLIPSHVRGEKQLARGYPCSQAVWEERNGKKALALLSAVWEERNS